MPINARQIEGCCSECDRPLPAEKTLFCGRPDCNAVAMANYRNQLATGAAGRTVDAAKTRDELERNLARCGYPRDRIIDLRATTDLDAMTAARKFARLGLKLLLLVGRSGIGKTVAAGHVLSHACARWPWNEGATGSLMVPAEFVEAHRLTLLSSFDGIDQDWIRHLHRVSLLVLDDVGDEASAFGRALIRSLLKERFENGKRSVVTSNLTFDAFRDRYGAELLDRARADGLMPDLSKAKTLRRPPAQTGMQFTQEVSEAE